MNFDTDPDADSDPRIRSLPFLSVILKTKSYFFTTFSCLLLFEGTFTPLSKHKKKSYRIQSQSEKSEEWIWKSAKKDLYLL